jgi:hypothetical protein
MRYPFFLDVGPNSTERFGAECTSRLLVDERSPEELNSCGSGGWITLETVIVPESRVHECVHTVGKCLT